LYYLMAAILILHISISVRFTCKYFKHRKDLGSAISVLGGLDGADKIGIIADVVLMILFAAASWFAFLDLKKVFAALAGVLVLDTAIYTATPLFVREPQDGGADGGRQ